MTMTIQDFLDQYPETRQDAQDWLRSLGLTTPMSEAWLRYNRADWMLNALYQIGHKSFPGPRHFACDCADHVLQRARAIGHEPNPQSWAAVEAARAWLEGRGSREQMLKAGAAAWTAYRATWGADMAADMAARTAADTTNESAAGAAGWVAETARSGGAAEQAWQADRLRHYVPEWPG